MPVTVGALAPVPSEKPVAPRDVAAHATSLSPEGFLLGSSIRNLMRISLRSKGGSVPGRQRKRELQFERGSVRPLAVRISGAARRLRVIPPPSRTQVAEPREESVQPFRAIGAFASDRNTQSTISTHA